MWNRLVLHGGNDIFQRQVLPCSLNRRFYKFNLFAKHKEVFPMHSRLQRVIDFEPRQTSSAYSASLEALCQIKHLNDHREALFSASCHCSKPWEVFYPRPQEIRAKHNLRCRLKYQQSQNQFLMYYILFIFEIGHFSRHLRNRDTPHVVHQYG